MTASRIPPAGRLLPARAGSRGDSGSVSLEVVVLFPAALLLVLAAVQGALWFHARSVATAAAAAGVTAGRVEGAPAGAAVAAAVSVVERSGGDRVLRGATATGTSGAVSVSVTVTGSAPEVVPGVLDLSVSQTVTGAVERVTSPGDP